MATLGTSASTARLTPWALLALLLLPATAPAQLRVTGGEALSGGRFGVGYVKVTASKSALPPVLGVDGLRISDAEGRLLYPAIHNPAVGRVAKDVVNELPWLRGGPVREDVRGLLGQLLDQPPPATIYFLFKGDGPLQLTVEGRTGQTVALTPHGDPAAHKRLLTEWWEQYTPRPKFLEVRPEYPPVVENYLRTTLARRLGLELPEREQTPSWQDELAADLALLLPTESIRVAMQQDRILGLTNLHLPADQPLPAPIEPEPLDLPEVASEVKVEPIAMRTPADCFYVRFGNFANFVWIQDTMERWGGDLENLMHARSLQYGMRERMEEQLVVELTAVSRMLGNTLVADVALVGADTFFREGAAYGLLFQARNTTMLGMHFAQQRRQRMAEGGVVEEKITVDGREVSLLTSADDRVRSYYVVDGDYHFHTTSKALAREFLATASGKGSLGQTREFRHARNRMPLSRGDTVFVYLSDAFFRRFTSPSYRIELSRRLEATADLELLQLAALASAVEGKPGDTVEQLIEGELLPPRFGPRPDGSRAMLDEGRAADSLRGGLGGMVPIPDVPVEQVTAAEATAYRDFAKTYEEKWGRLGPVTLAIKKHALDGGQQERIAIDLELSPISTRLGEFLAKSAGPPDQRALAPVRGDIFSGELLLNEQRLFWGLADFGPPLTMVAGQFIPTGRLRDILVGYVGTVGPVGRLGGLDQQITRPPDARGYAGGEMGLWRRQHDQFTLFSWHPEVLDAVSPQLKFQPAERPAQLRLRIGDVSSARMTPFLNNWAYVRTRETSLGNLRLMHAIHQQFGVPVEHCREAAELLLGAKLVCPLGGKYVLEEGRGGDEWWTSTLLVKADGQVYRGTEAPRGYVAPPLNWFRGLDLDALTQGRTLSAHAEVVMQLPQK